MVEVRKQVVAQITKSLNHHMDGQARARLPDLTEQERLIAALTDLRGRGIVEFTEEELLGALQTAEFAHNKMLKDPSFANQIVHSVISHLKDHFE